MKWKLIVTIISVIVIIACNKDKFQTRPTIRIKSINTKVLTAGSNNDLIINLEYTDKQGDLGKDTLVSIKNRLNRRPVPPVSKKVDTLYNIIPDFPNQSKGDLEIRFTYSNLAEVNAENDTIIFKFIAKDRGGNTSDTISTDKIIIVH